MVQDVTVVTLSELYSQVADEIVSRLSEAIHFRGEASLVLAGGNTFIEIYKLLANETYRRKISWEKVLLYFGYDRCVTPDSPLSNYRSVFDVWLHVWESRGPRVIRIKTELLPVVACKEYETHISTTMDVVLLGVGSDGHTASLFSKTRELWSDSEKLVVVTQAEMEPLGERISLTPLALSNSRRTLVVATGASKKTILTKVLSDTMGEFALSYCSALHGDTTVYLDQELAP